MPKSTLAGHPAHPIVITFPVGLLPFSLAMDTAYLFTGKKSFAQAAFYSMVGGFLGGVISAVTGAADYFSIPANTAAKKTANFHALLNLGLLALYGINLGARRGKEVPSGGAETMLSAAGSAALLLSSWYGASLIYEHGMRVQSVDPIAAAPEVRPPGDETLEKAFRSMQGRVKGPVAG